MRVLHVIGSVDPRYGGPIEGILRSHEVWARHGHVAHVLSLDAPDLDYVQTCPMTVFATGRRADAGKVFGLRLPFGRYGYTPDFVPWLKANAANYDAVIVNGLWNYCSVGTWRAMRNASVPYFVFSHGMLDPWFADTYKLKGRFKQLYWLLFERKALRDARSVLFTTEDERLLARTSFKPYSCRERVVGYGTVAPTGDPESQVRAFHEALPALKERRYLLFLGRIHPKKGPDLLIEAFAGLAERFPDVDLVMAGPDQIGWRDELVRMAERLKIGARVHWPGMIAGDVKWGAIRAAHAFVLPSHQENFGVVVAESLACGIPVLLTHKVNIWREVEAAGAGVAVSDDVEGVSAGLARLLDLTSEALADMKDAARACFLKHYDLETVALDLLRVVKGEERS